MTRSDALAYITQEFRQLAADAGLTDVTQADAYVAANLWDFKANIGVVAAPPRGVGVRATLAFK